jgi:hypothetical protein
MMQSSDQFILPLRLTVDEFASIVRECEETIRRNIRCGNIEARGRPYMIPARELLKFGISPGDVTEAHFLGLCGA